MNADANIWAPAVNLIVRLTAAKFHVKHAEK